MGGSQEANLRISGTIIKNQKRQYIFLYFKEKFSEDSEYGKVKYGIIIFTISPKLILWSKTVKRHYCIVLICYLASEGKLRH